MSDPYLSAVLEEAERVAEQHDQIARSTDHPAHEYLRYAFLRLLEGEVDETSADVPKIDGVTVGYGADDAMFDAGVTTSSGGRRCRPETGVPVSGSSTLTSTKSSRA